MLEALKKRYEAQIAEGIAFLILSIITRSSII